MIIGEGSAERPLSDQQLASDLLCMVGPMLKATETGD